MSDVDGVPTSGDIAPAKTDTGDQKRPAGSGNSRIFKERRNIAIPVYLLLVALLAAGAVLGAYTLHDDLIGEIGYWDVPHAATVALAGVFFLRCYHIAEETTCTYGPGRAPHLRWQLWLIPVVNLYMPRQLRNILIASSIPTSQAKPDSATSPLTPFERWTYQIFLASWIGLQAAGTCFIAAYWIAYARHGEVPFTLPLFDSLIQVFSIAGAACLMILVTRIAWLQRKRSKETYFIPPRGKWWLAPDAHAVDEWTPVENVEVFKWGWAIGCAFTGAAVIAGSIFVLPVFVVLVSLASQVTPLPLPPLQLSRQDLVGTWHGAGNATLTLRANGTFVARDLPEDLHYDADDFHVWSGSGWWFMSKDCEVNTPGICVTVDIRNATILDTAGSSFSPLLRFPDLDAPGADDLHK